MICTWRQLALLGCVETVVLLLGFDFARDMRVVFFFFTWESSEGKELYGTESGGLFRYQDVRVYSFCVKKRSGMIGRALAGGL